MNGVALLLIAAATLVRWAWIIGISVYFLALFNIKLPDNVSGVLRALAAETRPFYLPAIGVHMAMLMAKGQFWNDPWSLLTYAASVYLWFRYRSDDDDRWMRRRKKAKEAIKRIGSKLVVVPTAG